MEKVGGNQLEGLEGGSKVLLVQGGRSGRRRNARGSERTADVKRWSFVLTQSERTFHPFQVVDWIAEDSLKALKSGFAQIEFKSNDKALRMEVPDRRTNARMRRTKQARTSSYPSVGGAIVWNETFEFKVVTGKEELRFHVCNSKSKDRSYYSRIAACGLYLKDILNARLPLRNRFQMFSIKKGLEVGNLGLNLSWKEAEPSLKREADGTLAGVVVEKPKQKPFHARWRLPLYSLFVATSIAVVVSALKKNGKKKRGKKK